MSFIQSFIGNAGLVNHEELEKEYSQFLVHGEVIECKCLSPTKDISKAFSEMSFFYEHV